MRHLDFIKQLKSKSADNNNIRYFKLFKILEQLTVYFVMNVFFFFLDDLFCLT